MKQKKLIRKLLVISIITIMSSILFTVKNTVKADDSSSQYLNNVDYSIVVNEDGSMDVKEIWDIDIEYTNTLFKDFEIDTSKYSSINNCTVAEVKNGIETPLTDCGEYYYHVPTGQYYFLNRGGNYEVAWGTGMQNATGTKKYIIKYHVIDAIAKYNDCAELYWQAFGSEFGIGINKLTGTIKLPSKAESKDDIRVWGHTPDLNGTIYVTDLDKISFEINDNSAEKMIEIRVAMPTNMIETTGRTYTYKELSNIISEETEWANSANMSRVGKIVTVVVIMGIMYLLLGWIIYKNIKLITENKKIVPSQHYDYFRELPDSTTSPAAARMIIDNGYATIENNAIGQIFMATVLKLKLKKMIDLEKVNNGWKNDYLITINHDESLEKNLDSSEKIILQFIKNACGNNKTNITMKQLKAFIEFHNSSIVSMKNKLDNITKDELNTKNVISNEGIKKKNSLWYNSLPIFGFFGFFYIIATFPSLFSTTENAIGISVNMLFILIILLFASVITGIMAITKISVYSQNGVDMQDKWKAFKKYMEDFSLLKEREIPELVLWENYLVYAAAFGIAEKVIKQLKIVYTEYNEFDNSFMTNYVVLSMLSDSDIYNSFNSVSSATSLSFSSGSGGGGGFSGGGGGGGGRRRRRRKITPQT